MSVKRSGLGVAFFIMAVLSTWVLSASLRAATIEIEDEVDEISPAATPLPKAKAKTNAKTNAKAKGVSEPRNVVAETPEKPMARVRISDKIGFYYFVKSGYVVSDPSQASAVGGVTGRFEDNISYSTPKKTYIEFSSSNQMAKKGDRFVIYRGVETVKGSNSTLFGYWVRNLAVVKVLEAERGRCLVEVTQSFYPFEVGDKVKAYDDELKRWKQAQVKKELPAHVIECPVAGGNPEQHHFIQGECIVLAAGSKQGVVEGQEFALKLGKETGPFEPGLHLPMGKVQVFYAGPDFSMAQILFSHQGVETGFEVKYQP